ncbi:hypothetical protein P7K49_007317, partial [Saguinus oedipus]
ALNWPWHDKDITAVKEHMQEERQVWKVNVMWHESPSSLCTGGLEGAAENGEPA